MRGESKAKERDERTNEKSRASNSESKDLESERVSEEGLGIHTAYIR